MPKEPTVQGRSLNQSAIDAIAARIDAYDQAWERRWEESDKRWNERMERLESSVERISTGVEEIRGFVGQSAELQIQTQNKLDALADDIKQMNASWDTRMNQLGDRIDRIAGNLEASQQTVAELTKLVTVLVNRVAA